MDKIQDTARTIKIRGNTLAKLRSYEMILESELNRGVTHDEAISILMERDQDAGIKVGKIFGIIATKE